VDYCAHIGFKACPVFYWEAYASNRNLILTNYLTRSWEANGHTASKEISWFYGFRRFIVVFTRVRHLFLPWARCFQATPSHTCCLRYILILSSNLRFGLLNSLPFRFSNGNFVRLSHSLTRNTISISVDDSHSQMLEMYTTNENVCHKQMSPILSYIILT